MRLIFAASTWGKNAHIGRTEPQSLHTALYFLIIVLGIFFFFLLWQWEGLHMQSACVVSQSGGRQAGRCSAQICLLSSSCLLLGSSQSAAHHAHTHASHTTASHILGCDIEAEGVEWGEREENQESIYSFWKRNSWENIMCSDSRYTAWSKFRSRIYLWDYKITNDRPLEPVTHSTLLRVWPSVALLRLRLSILLKSHNPRGRTGMAARSSEVTFTILRWELRVLN